jgi:hypothetical protein
MKLSISQSLSPKSVENKLYLIMKKPTLSKQ